MAASLALGTALSSVGGAFKSIPKEVYIIGAGIGVTVLLVNVIKKAADKARYNAAINVIGKDTKKGMATMLATQLYSAMYNSVLPTWFPDGTNEVLIYKVAQEMHKHQITFDLVSDQYKKLYSGRQLLSDLESELDENEMRYMWSYLETGSKPAPLVHESRLNGFEINITLA
ncbi:hypothetical protein [Aureibacter tunicatorum]|uniref:Uncharacterized protein n=1 Tax=Aureibacter tunicatorum TaxID=866807 RepID=A0AAE3XR89_9BACT|nr:hypothetical protein [Aureibacter tunicatorum]MDR6239974.1 hypothetical protein [Aureibacter tunicatorum]BDD04446.1 hypothetical protein AUTU_19290 [Aureibacter tunicatorum]